MLHSHPKALNYCRTGRGIGKKTRKEVYSALNFWSALNRACYRWWSYEELLHILYGSVEHWKFKALTIILRVGYYYWRRGALAQHLWVKCWTKRINHFTFMSLAGEFLNRMNSCLCMFENTSERKTFCIRKSNQFNMTLIISPYAERSREIEV